jgi:hypothetical protein
VARAQQHAGHHHLGGAIGHAGGTASAMVGAANSR